MIDPKILQESRAIASPTRDGKLPLTFVTSTRKSGHGPVQKEIEKADSTGLVVKHWNIIDVTKKCEPERHQPNKAKVNLYVDSNKLEHISESEYLALSKEHQIKYVKRKGYAGCAKCPLFAACGTKLATEQKSNSNFLKPIKHTIDMIRSSSLDFVKNQLLCLTPSMEGAIFPHFDRNIHMITAAQMYEKVNGEKPNMNDFKKADLIRYFKENQMSFYSGMDHGYTHPFAVVTGALFGHRMFIFDVISISGLELKQRVELVKARLGSLDPVIFPDPAYPADNITFRRNGFRTKSFTKDVLASIESVRHKLNPGPGLEPELYLLKDDDGCESLAGWIKDYHWKLDAAGNPTEIPDKVDDDAVDALRYLCQNLFAKIGQKDKTPEKLPKEKLNWLQEEIAKRVDQNDPFANKIGGKTGGFRWKF